MAGNIERYRSVGVHIDNDTYQKLEEYRNSLGVKRSKAISDLIKERVFTIGMLPDNTTAITSELCPQ